MRKNQPSTPNKHKSTIINVNAKNSRLSSFLLLLDYQQKMGNGTASLRPKGVATL
jgi:hypothetical protein